MNAERHRVEVKHYGLFFKSKCLMCLTDDFVYVLVDSLFNVDVTTFYLAHMVLYVAKGQAFFGHRISFPPFNDASRGTLLDDKLYWKFFQSHSPAMGPPSLLDLAGHGLLLE